jgi:hypothetical protein
MNGRIGWLRAMGCAGVVLLGVVAVQGDQSGVETRASLRSGNCSVGDVRGTYGFSRSGTTTQGPIAAVGKGIFDGRGAFSVVQTTSRNGVVSEGSFDGLYAVDPDCTGRWLSADGQSTIAYFVLVDDGHEFMFLSTSAGNMITGVSKRISKGSY